MMADKNGEIKEKYTRDTLFQKLLFVAFGLDYNIIFEDYDHHTHPTLKKVRAFSCLFVVKKHIPRYRQLPGFQKKRVQFPKVEGVQKRCRFKK